MTPEEFKKELLEFYTNKINEWEKIESNYQKEAPEYCSRATLNTEYYWDSWEGFMTF